MHTIYSLPPADYSATWYVVIAVVCVLVIGWFIAFPFITRRRIEKRMGVTLHTSQRAYLSAEEALRERYRARISQLAERRQAGEITDRELHQDLSVVVREFVTERIGVRAETMTLTDLLANQATAPMAYVIERCYTPAFSREGAVLPEPGVADPRLVTIGDALAVVNGL